MHWCIFSVATVGIITVIIRFLIRKSTTDGRIIILVDEFLGNFCSGVFIMELGVIASMYGSYSWQMFIAGFVHLFLKGLYFIQQKLYSDPLSFLSSYYDKHRRFTFSLFHVCTIIIVQVVALLVSQPFARYIWAFEDHSHVDAMKVLCTTALSSAYPWYYAALAEGTGCFIGTVIDFNTPMKLKAYVQALVAMTLSFMGMHVSGMFRNPVVATAFSFRCTGHTNDLHHVLVYWVGPAIGVILAWEFWMASKKYVKKIPEKVD